MAVLASARPQRAEVVRPQLPEADPSVRLRTAAVVLGLLGIVWPGWLIAGMPHDLRGPDLAYALQILILLYVAVRLGMIYAAGRPDWLQITFWGFVYTWLGLAPLIQLIAGRTPFRQAINYQIGISQALTVMVGILAYDAGRTLADRLPVAPPKYRRTIAPRRVLVASVLAVIITPALVQVSGGLSAVFSSREARTAALVTAGYYSDNSKSVGALISAAATVLPFVALYCVLVLRQQGHRVLQSRLSFVLLCLLLLISNALLNNPISSSRFWVLTVLLAFVFVVPAFQSMRWVRAVVGGFVVSSAAVFPYLDAYRYSDVNVQQRPIWYFLAYKLDYDAMAQIGNSVRFVGSQGHLHGHQLLGTLLFWVPRRWWSDKPVDTGSLLAQHTGYRSLNLSGPLWAEMLVDFGLIGVVGCFVLLGYFSRRWTARYLLALARPTYYSALIGAYPIFAMYQVLILRGSLLQAMGRLAVLIVLWLLLTRRESVGSSPPRGSRGFPSRVV
jgi:hypothetical protein